MARRAAPEVEATTAAPTEKPKRTPKAKADPASNGEVKRREKRGDRGWLAQSVEAICRKHAAGKKITGVEPGDPLTVNTLRSLIKNNADEQPSTGAVSAVLLRWATDGYIKKASKPLAFTGYTAKYADSNLATYLEDRKAKKPRAKKAATAAA